MILEALGDYLVTNNKGALGSTIFLGKMPASPDYCITVYEYEGVPPKESFGTAAFDIDMPRIQVVVRAARDDYPTARDAAESIRQLFASITNLTISSTKVLRVASIGSTLPLGLDDKDRPRISANFQAYVERQ
jgi:hypothetical protein